MNPWFFGSKPLWKRLGYATEQDYIDVMNGQLFFDFYDPKSNGLKEI